MHLRELHRQFKPSNDRERYASERRELITKNLLSNLRRTGDHPTLSMLLEIADMFSLTIEGAHRLFGYDLAGIREYDRRLNGGRTHIVDMYPFERDLLVDLPLELAPSEAFTSDGTLRELVRSWQRDVPLRALRGPAWRRPGAFYVHVGTEDSLGSSLPPGAMSLVEPIDDTEMRQPNPRSIYLLQFANGYRCSRCVVTRGRLQLLNSERSYSGPQEFSYPTSVRIAGRIRMFSVSLPLPEYPQLSFARYQGSAELVLPWEHRTRDRLLSTKHRRFHRLQNEEQAVREFLQAELHSKFSDRTWRRYRSPGSSEPHVPALLQLTLAHFTRYTDSLQAVVDTGSGTRAGSRSEPCLRRSTIASYRPRVEPQMPPCRERFGRQGKESLWLVSLDEVREAGDELHLELPRREKSPFENCAEIEHAHLLAEALLTLKPQQREIVQLRFHSEMSLAEIAQITNASLPSVKTRFYRAMCLLRTQVKAALSVSSDVPSLRLHAKQLDRAMERVLLRRCSAGGS
jgi:RNA polymerase sigma factor (sigma-70 family)